MFSGGIDVESQVEIALDDGFITTGDAQGNHRQRILELELELLGGPVDALLDLAHTLVLGPGGWAADALRLRPAQRSKAERGYALFAGDAIDRVQAAGARQGADSGQRAGQVQQQVQRVDRLRQQHAAAGKTL